MSSTSSLLVGALVLAFVLWRQLQPRAVREESPFRLMVILGVLGVVELVSFAGNHSVNGAAWALLAASIVVGGGFGIVRGLTVRIWRENGVLLRQGTVVTVLLWAVGLGIHVLVDVAITGVDSTASGLGSTGILLYLGVTLAAQRFVTLNRAAHLT
jgi:hypothetical protein